MVVRAGTGHGRIWEQTPSPTSDSVSPQSRRAHKTLHSGWLYASGDGGGYQPRSFSWPDQNHGGPVVAPNSNPHPTSCAGGPPLAGASAPQSRGSRSGLVASYWPVPTPGSTRTARRCNVARASSRQLDRGRGDSGAPSQAGLPLKSWRVGFTRHQPLGC